MIDCIFGDEPNPDGLWQCKRCGRVYPRKSDSPPTWNCPKAMTPEEKQQRIEAEAKRQAELQPAAERLGIKPKHVKRYAKALAKWTAAGFPTRTQEETGACVTVCQACEHYTERGRCRKCGCCVNTSRVAVVNKAKMRTEDCPEGKWRK